MPGCTEQLSLNIYFTSIKKKKKKKKLQCKGFILE